MKIIVKNIAQKAHLLNTMLLIGTLVTSCGTVKTLQNTVTDREVDIDKEILNTKIDMGRFVESDITPIETENAYIVNSTIGSNGEYLLTINDKKEPKSFLYIEENWIEQGNEFLVEFLDDKKYDEFTSKIVCDFKGNWWIFLNEEEGIGKGYRISSEGEVLEIDIPGVKFFQEVVLEENNNLIYLEITTNNERDYLVIDGNTGEVLKNEIPNNYQIHEAVDDKIIVTKDYENDEQVIVYDVGEAEILEIYEMPKGFYWGDFTISNQQIILLDERGIHKREPEGTILQIVVDDKSFVYSNKSNISYGIKIHGNPVENKYMITCIKNEELKVYTYVFDENIPIKKNNSLSIWALEDTGITEAVAIFSQENSDCEVTVEFGKNYTTMGEVEQSTDDIINKLNAKLLAGDVPDILYLDGLYIDGLNQNGLLDTIDIELDEQNYYEHILNSYTNEKGTYAYPTYFHTFLMASDGSIDDFQNKNMMEHIVPLYVDPNVIKNKGVGQIFFDYFHSMLHQIFQDNNAMNEEELTTFLEQTKEIVTLDKNKKSTGNFRHGGTTMDIKRIFNMRDASYFFLSHKNVEILPLLDGTYLNRNITAIPVGAENKEQGELFIHTLLDNNEIQGLKGNPQTGFAVKKGVELELMKSFNEPTGEIVDSDYYQRNTNQYKDCMAFDWEKMINSLEYGCEEDQILFGIVYTSAEIYYEDGHSLEEAVAQIMNQMDVLFAERS